MPSPNCTADALFFVFGRVVAQTSVHAGRSGRQDLIKPMTPFLMAYQYISLLLPLLILPLT